MAHLAGRPSRRWVVCGVAFGITSLALLVLQAISLIKQTERTIATQKQLLARITNNTPISGFYGPGSWWAWLITLGMTHGHMGAGLVATGELSEEWDFDLVGASLFLIAAEIDLIIKAHTIAQLGDAASQSQLLPALLCAERVVTVGIGSSAFTVLTALRFLRTPVGRRRAVISTTPLILGFIASWFTFKAHLAISQAAPVLWCRLHDGQKHEDIPFALMDFLPWAVSHITLPWFYTSVYYWVGAALLGCMYSTGELPARLREILGRWRLTRDSSLWSAALFIVSVLSLPLIVRGIPFALGTAFWLISWVISWPLVYILAFFPQMEYFPLTGMSVTDMDQLAALLAVAFIAAVRSGRRIFQALRHRANSLAHRANSPAPGANPPKIGWYYEG